MGLATFEIYKDETKQARVCCTHCFKRANRLQRLYGGALYKILAGQVTFLGSMPFSEERYGQDIHRKQRRHTNKRRNT